MPTALISSRSAWIATVRRLSRLAAANAAVAAAVAEVEKISEDCDKHMDENVLVSALQDHETSKAEEEKERKRRSQLAAQTALLPTGRLG